MIKKAAVLIEIQVRNGKVEVIMENSQAILVHPKQFEIEECPIPEPKAHEILMKVEYVGMCGSDIHGFEFGPTWP